MNLSALLNISKKYKACLLISQALFYILFYALYIVPSIKKLIPRHPLLILYIKNEDLE